MILPLYIKGPGDGHTHMGQLNCSRCRVAVGCEWRWAVANGIGIFPPAQEDEIPPPDYRTVTVQFQEFATGWRNLYTGERGRTTFWIAAVLVQGSYDDLLRLDEFQQTAARAVSRSQFREDMDSPPTLTLEEHPQIRCVPRDLGGERAAEMVSRYLNLPSNRERLRQQLADAIYNLTPMATPFMTTMGTRQPVGGCGTSADTTPPEDTKPLAPLPDWLKEVDSILAEHTPQPGEP